MKKYKYKGFTLVEMLVVMGILIILMTMGIAAGRFAIQRANRVQHQNAADQLYQGLQAYYTDNREFPVADQDLGQMLASGGYLEPYVDSKSYNGGSDASFFYTVDGNKQSVLVCVTYGGIDDVQEQGGYCAGNGFGVLPESGGTKVSNKDMDSTTFQSLVSGNGFLQTDWKSKGGWQ